MTAGNIGVIMISNKKKSFPPGTFIATPLRIIAILQLCIAFTVLTSYAGYPFMRELYEIKTRKLLYETVMGKEDKEAALRFSLLSSDKKAEVAEEYRELQLKSNTPFGEKLKRSLHILMAKIPPFEKAWLTFSILISVLLLMKIEGAATAAWLLPLIVTAYSVDCMVSKHSSSLSKEEALFPSQMIIVNEYLREPLKANILDQKAQLEKGWKLYLIKEWSKAEPSQEPSLFQEQVKEGEFRFNLARASAIATEPLKADTKSFQRETSLPALLLYFAWNVFFAWFINRKKWTVQPLIST
jgi:hypothetical protein